MIRHVLPAAIFAIGTPLAAQTLAQPPAQTPYQTPDQTQGQTLEVPGLSGNNTEASQTCANIPGSPDNCVRVLACVGDQGVYFDGQGIGWDTGTLRGFMSDGVDCTGTWSSQGLGGTGTAQLTCDGGLTAEAIYYSQDGETGTAIGRGRDSQGRFIKVWSGINVLAYLTSDGEPALPCTAGPIPIS